MGGVVTKKKKEHIVMIPFLAQGHLIPFLALANQIHHTTNFNITIATTPLNAHYLRSSAISSSKIHVAELPFASEDHNLPPNREPPSRANRQPFLRLVAEIAEREGGRPPLCLISDVLFGWGRRRRGELRHRDVTSDEELFQILGFPERCRLRQSQLHPFLRRADGTDSWSRFFQPQIKMATKSLGWICNTVEEMELFGLEVLRNYIKVPVWSILASNVSVKKKYSGKKSGISAEKCIKWLDDHGNELVVYVSLGSQNTISSSQMMDLALGLEKSGKPLIWAIRPHVGYDLKSEFRGARNVGYLSAAGPRSWRYCPTGPPARL